MKRALCIAGLLALVIGLYAQDFQEVFFPKNLAEPIIVNFTRYNRETQASERIYRNKDYCSYMVVRRGARHYNALPGENVVESRPAKTQTAMNNFSTTDFRSYRGVFPKKADSLFVYALPVPVGTKVVAGNNLEYMRDRRETYMSFRTEDNDTICAMRGGVVCISGSNHGVVINHTDETFAVYTQALRSLVKPGDEVEVGQPIAIMKAHETDVRMLYLDQQYFRGSEMAEQYPYTYFIPRVWDGTEYKALPEGCVLTAQPLSDDLITQDMSKAQRKHYFKRKNNR